MKRITKILIIFFLLLLFILLLGLFKKDKIITYSRNNYDIEEKRFYSNGFYNYYFNIKDFNIKFNVLYSSNIKKDKMIKQINTYKYNNFNCILPIYKKDIGSLYCNRSGNNYSYEIMNNKYNNDFKIIKNMVKKDGYFIYNYKGKEINKYNNKYYSYNNINNYNFIIWNYTGIDIVNDKGVIRKDLLINNDLYNNKYSTLVNNNYVLLDDNFIDKIFYYDIKSNKKKYIKLIDKMSGNYNILGVYNNELYLVDLDGYKEYKINFDKKSVELIGSRRKNYITIINNEEKKVLTRDFKNNINKYVFDKKIDIKDNNIKYQYTKYIKDNNRFYRDGNNNKMFLFELNDVVDYKIINDNILLISNGNLYFYNDLYGLKLIYYSNELKFNYNNIYSLYKGSL